MQESQKKSSQAKGNDKTLLVTLQIQILKSTALLFKKYPV